MVVLWVSRKLVIHLWIWNNFQNRLVQEKKNNIYTGENRCTEVIPPSWLGESVYPLARGIVTNGDIKAAIDKLDLYVSHPYSDVLDGTCYRRLHQESVFTCNRTDPKLSRIWTGRLPSLDLPASRSGFPGCGFSCRQATIIQ